jgi:tRNA-dihydrouridine synthase 3
VCRCKMSHDLDAYLRTKDIDVNFPSWENFHYSTESPYVLPPHLQNPFAALSINDDTTTPENTNKDVSQSIDLSTTCPVYEALGYCPSAWKCRFLGGHIERCTSTESPSPRWIGGDDGSVKRMVPPETIGGWKVKVDEEKKERVEKEGREGEMNNVTNDDLRALSRKTVSVGTLLGSGSVC